MQGFQEAAHKVGHCPQSPSSNAEASEDSLSCEKSALLDIHCQVQGLNQNHRRQLPFFPNQDEIQANACPVQVTGRWPIDAPLSSWLCSCLRVSTVQSPFRE